MPVEAPFQNFRRGVILVKVKEDEMEAHRKLASTDCVFEIRRETELGSNLRNEL